MEKGGKRINLNFGHLTIGSSAQRKITRQRCRQRAEKKTQMKTESKTVREQFGSLQRGHGQDWRMKLLSKAKGMTTTTAIRNDKQTRL